MSTADQAATAVRQANARDVLLTLRDAPAPLTVAQLAGSTALSRPTVDSVLADLVDRGPVRAAGPTSDTVPGRPARRFTFLPGSSVVAGIDVGARLVRCRLVDSSGHTVGRSTAPATADPGSRLDAVTEAVRQSITDLGDGDSDGAPRLAATGVAVPGILGTDDAITQSLAVPDWVGLDLTGELSDRLECAVRVENDIKLAGYAEQQIGAGSGVDNLVYLQLGHRISVTIMVDGTILQGSHRLAGELGSRRGMKWTQSSRRGRLRWSTGEDAERLFDAAAAGDPSAIEEIDGFCAEIAPELATLLLTVDPELIVVGGGLSRAGRTLLTPLRQQVHRLLMTPDKPPLTRAHLSTEGPITGALGYAFEHGSTDIFGVPHVPPPWHRLRADADLTTTTAGVT